MKLFLTVALSLMMIALIAHAQSLPPPYPPPNYPPPAYAPPPPAPEPGVMVPAPGTARVIPPQQPYAPQQAMPPAQSRLEQQAPEPLALQPQQQGSVTFVSGGGGDEDRDAL